MITGKNLSLENIETATNRLSLSRIEGSTKYKGEIEQSPEILKSIEIINSCLKQEFNDLGIPEMWSEVKAEQYHLLHSSTFFDLRWVRSTEGVLASFMARSCEILVNFDDFIRRGTIADLQSTLLHESVHANSFQKFSYHNLNNVVIQERIGYQGRSSEGFKKQNFLGLNEAVTEKLARELFNKNKSQFKGLKLFQEKETAEDYQAYDGYISVLDFLIEKIADKNQVSSEEVWKKFKKGMMTGEMMHLREIEKVFGQKSLLIISLLGNEGLESYWGASGTNLILLYLYATTESQQQKLREKIFEIMDASKEPRGCIIYEDDDGYIERPY